VWIGTEDGTVLMDSNKDVTAVFVKVEDFGEEAVTVLPEAPGTDIILDGETPAASPDDIQDEPLPQTGGLPLAAYAGFGLVVSGFGVKLRRKNK